MKLRGIVQTKPNKFGGDPPPGLVDIEAEGADYEQARTALDALVPDGARLISIRTW